MIKKGMYIGGFGFFYMVLSVLLYFLTKNGLSVWLGINVFLALIPVGLIVLLEDYQSRNENKIDLITLVLFLSFIFFLPNSFYIVTDYIHLQAEMFYDLDLIGYIAEQYYVYSIRPYLLLLHIFLSSLIGVVAFIFSFNHLAVILKEFLQPKKKHIFMVVLMLLSSIGIYIGRFLRFFSWDILNPIKIIKQLYEDFSLFMITFILLFTVLQVIVYYGYVLLTNKKLI